MANIKFEIFRNRKKFNIINWLKSREDKTYETFFSFLKTKSVISPGEEYFNKALDLVQSMEQREQAFQDKKVEKKETVPIEVEVVLPELKEETIVKVPEEKPKPKTRRRRRKNSQDES